MIHYSNPPHLLHDVIPDLAPVIDLLERNAPYSPLGGWFRPGVDRDATTNALWFQKDWVHADFRAEGSDLFLHNEHYLRAARAFYDAEVVLPQSVYVNLMGPCAKAGPAHTDNPRFEGRDRTNTSMALLRLMLWSGLFDDRAIVQATAIWWMNDVEGGELLYWPEGPEKPPHRHGVSMANTALVGDNHGMFHQVAPIGPFDREPPLVSPAATLAPAVDGGGSDRRDWVVLDRGVERLRVPLSGFRVSVLWKADVYRDEADRRRRTSNRLSLEDVARGFDRDLDAKRAGMRFDLARLDDPGFMNALRAVYPEAEPLGRLASNLEAPKPPARSA